MLNTTKENEMTAREKFCSRPSCAKCAGARRAREDAKFRLPMIESNLRFALRRARLLDVGSCSREEAREEIANLFERRDNLRRTIAEVDAMDREARAAAREVAEGSDTYAAILSGAMAATAGNALTPLREKGFRFGCDGENLSDICARLNGGGR